MWELWGVEMSAFPLTWHIAYTTACCYRTSRDSVFCAAVTDATHRLRGGGVAEAEITRLRAIVVSFFMMSLDINP